MRNSASGNSARAPTDVPYHPSYNGLVFFQNTFDGQLPATDYPKVTVSFDCEVLLSVSDFIGFCCAVLFRYVPGVRNVRRCMGMAVL